MTNLRAWIFRLLIIAGAGLMVYSFIIPWWGIWIWELGPENVVEIYPYGLWLDYDTIGVYSHWVDNAPMPAYFAPLMWAYLGICIVALLFALWKGNKEIKITRFRFNLAKLIIGLVGFSYIFVAVLAVIVAAIRTGDYFDVHLIGYNEIKLGGFEQSGAEANLLLGYWLSLGTGLFFMVMALLRNKIIGKNKTIS